MTPGVKHDTPSDEEEKHQGYYNMNDYNKTISQSHEICTDCGQPLDTYALKDRIIGTCANPECRLYGVTLDTETLRKLTECERVAWGKSTASIRAMFEQEQRERDIRVARIPQHLRRLG